MKLEDTHSRVDVMAGDLVQVELLVTDHKGRTHTIWFCEQLDHHSPPATLTLQGSKGEKLVAVMKDVRIWRRK